MKSVRADTPTFNISDDQASGSSSGSTEVIPSTPSSVATSTGTGTGGITTKLGTFTIIEDQEEVDYELDDGKVTESLGKKGKEVDRGGETD